MKKKHLEKLNAPTFRLNLDYISFNHMPNNNIFDNNNRRGAKRNKNKTNHMKRSRKHIFEGFEHWARFDFATIAQHIAIRRLHKWMRASNRWVVNGILLLLCWCWSRYGVIVDVAIKNVPYASNVVLLFRYFWYNSGNACSVEVYHVWVCVCVRVCLCECVRTFNFHFRTLMRAKPFFSCRLFAVAVFFSRSFCRITPNIKLPLKSYRAGRGLIVRQMPVQRIADKIRCSRTTVFLMFARFASNAHNFSFIPVQNCNVRLSRVPFGDHALCLFLL